MRPKKVILTNMLHETVKNKCTNFHWDWFKNKKDISYKSIKYRIVALDVLRTVYEISGYVFSR